ncbi:MAG: phage integrase N-terminal SAM-like domain-containing protein [Anaerolineales bacterium]|nr:phage integrase N-terminal SAM-like domain-containing protein [Anaerolineales bacterium]
MAEQNQDLSVASTDSESGLYRITANTSLKAAIGAFRKHMQYEGFSSHTVQAFGSDLNLFGKYLGIGQPVGKVTTKNLNDFLHWMLNVRGVPCSPKTYARRVTTLKVFFKWLHSGGVLLHDPSGAVIQRSVKSPLPVILNAEELELVYAAGEKFRQGIENQGDSRPILLLDLLIKTGIKKSEAMGITLNHIDRSDPENPVVFIRYRNPSKRYKERKIDLDSNWLTLLDEYIVQYNPQDTLFTCTARNLEYVLRDLEEMSGVKKAVSFECLRWTSVVHGYMDGIDSEALRIRMGLSEITWRETLTRIQRLADSLKEN